MEATTHEQTTTNDDDVLLYEALQLVGDLEYDDEELPLMEGISQPLSLDDNLLFSNDATQHLMTPPSPVLTCSTTAETGPSTTPWTSSSSPLKTKKKRGNPSRTRRRLELIYLRDLVGELEQRLKVLEEKATDQRQKSHETVETTQPSTFMLVSWQQLAKRQYEQRQQATIENARLKRMLQDQIQLGQTLERLLLRKRSKLQDIYPRNLINTGPRRRRLSMTWNDHQIFNELFASIDSQYMETSDILAQAERRIHDNHGHRNVELVRDERLGLILLSTEYRMLPFDYEIVVQEFWSSLPAILNGRPTYVEDVDISDDFSKLRFEAHATFGHTSGIITMYLVDRRMTEANRTVFLSAGFYDPTKIAHTPMNGIYMRHRDWVVFEPIVSDSGQVATKMTMYLVAIPEIFEDLDNQSRKIGILTNFVMTGLSVELEDRQQAFENRLFNRTLQLAARRN